MKKIISIILLACMAVVTLSSCNNAGANNTGSGEGNDAVGFTPDKDFSSAVNDFSFELLEKTLENGNNNAILSPLSVMIALGMLETGAEGDSLSEMEAVLGLSRDKLRSYLYEFMRTLPEDEIVKIANSLWVKDTYSVKQDFIKTNSDYYRADVYNKPFTDATREEINDWISDNTDGMIEDMLKEIDPSTVMYLINTILFDGKWLEEYDENELIKYMFLTADGTEKKVDMMFFELSEYIEYNDAVGFKKDYDGDRYTFVALLPKEGQSVSEFVASVDPGKLIDAVNAPKKGTAAARLPLFSYESAAEMGSILSDMGMPTLFIPHKADLSGIADDSRLHVGQVLHNAKIELTTSGTKAAGATIVDVRTESAVMYDAVISLDRPFVYMIFDKQANIPLFVGAVNDIGD